MINKVENISKERLEKIRILVGEAFVTNELFHNWGSVEERRDDVMKYMALYVDYVIEAGELYANEDFTGFIGLEDSGNPKKLPQLKMLLRMLTTIKFSKLKNLMRFVKQIVNSNEAYAKNMSKELGIPLLFDTDMKQYAEMYQHFGCELYNTVTADNGVTRYNLCFK